MSRVYMDWNASAPLRPEAHAAMIAAMDVVGNPSSVHTEGRAAKAIVERARGQIAALVGCEVDEIVFTSGATEAASVLDRRLQIGSPGFFKDGSFFAYVPDIAHDCLIAHRWHFKGKDGWHGFGGDSLAMSIADGETGMLMKPQKGDDEGWRYENLGPAAWLALDVTQAVGKVHFNFPKTEAQLSFFSSHKLGGPKGAGALMCRNGVELTPFIMGGGQEMGRRSGTENVIGIAGFGAAAEAAKRDLANGEWDRVAELRDYLEDRIAEIAPDTIFFGKDVSRLPNTSCFAVPGWKGETQVMQMDLAGYAISAGSACSSGKVKPSRVLQAMGYDEITAGSAIRVSLGPPHTKDDINGFAAAWGKAYHKFRAKAA